MPITAALSVFVLTVAISQASIFRATPTLRSYSYSNLIPSSSNQPLLPQSQSPPYSNPTYSRGSYIPPSPQYNPAENPNNEGIAVDSENRRKFERFKLEKGKFYGTSELEMYRFGVFQQNRRRIQEFNARQGETYKMGVNQFTDMTKTQFKNSILMKTFNPPTPTSNQPSSSSPDPYLYSTSTPTPTLLTIDWVTKGKLGPIKHQGNCGSCWAFSVVATIESHVAIKRSTLPGIYSEQQLLDCCERRGFGCGGCEGSWTGYGFQYVASAGLADSIYYPYQQQPQYCKDKLISISFPKYLNPTTPFTLSTSTSTPSTSTSFTLSKLSLGPVSVIIDASNWFTYQSGIFNGCSPQVEYNHAVVLVGVDVGGNWKLRNSWGGDWGEAGYVRVAGGVGRDCGVTGWVISPNLI